MQKNVVINHEFKNYKKTEAAKRKRRTRILAILGCILMLSGVVGSLVSYLL